MAGIGIELDELTIDCYKLRTGELDAHRQEK